jgi:DNA-binding MarR family transcriptional regulator
VQGAARELDFGHLSDDIGFQIHQSRRAVRMRMRGRAPFMEKPPPGGTLSILILVELNPGVSQNELADALHLDSSKVAHLVGQLHGRGMVRKSPSPGDKRRQDLTLTPAGAALAEEIRRRSDERTALLGDCLNPSERAQLVALLAKFQRGTRTG